MTPREPLIMLAHRIPYPPNKGDKIRSYHLLRFLAERHEVHLGAFVDDPADFAHTETLQQWCRSVHLEPLGPVRSRLRMIPAVLTGSPLSIAAYRSSTLRRWVRDTVQSTGARHFVGFSAATAQYAHLMPPDAHRVLDMVDVDSDKWRQYGARHRGPMGWLYRREARCLLDCERAAARAHDAVTLVSPAEADLFRQLAPATADRVSAVSNGVDCEYFSPASRHENPFAGAGPSLLFTGAMDYWPNVDAVTWFADEILPRVREQLPNAEFNIVGARPSAAVQALGRRDGVRVVGATPDMRPWLQHADLVVAPLRVARGIQNKVLEGFAMARPVLATTMALEGLELDEDYPLCADEPGEFTRRVLESLASRGRAEEIGARMRAWVEARYDWNRRLAPFATLLESASVPVRHQSERLAAG